MNKTKALMVNLDEAILKALRDRAAENCRTITAELTLILKKALGVKPEGKK